MALGWRKNYLRYRSFFLDIYRVYYQRPDLKIYLELLLSLAVVSFFGVFALRPTVLTILELISQNRAKEETLNKMDEKIQNLNTAVSLFNQEAVKIALLETAVPETAAPDNFVRQFEGLTKRHNVNILGLAIGEVILLGSKEKPKRRGSDLEELPQDAGELSFSFSVSGDFATLNNLLADLNNMRRPVKIDSAIYNSSETESGNILVLIVSGRTPYFKEIKGR